jgi:hypothetical protein
LISKFSQNNKTNSQTAAVDVAAKTNVQRPSSENSANNFSLGNGKHFQPNVNNL